MYSFCAIYSFKMSFWSVPEIFFQSAPCFSATARYIAQMTAAGELMVIEVVTFARGILSNSTSMSASLSWLFSSAGWSVSFSEACSLAEGFRSVDDGSKGGAACVVHLDFSIMLIAPRQGFEKTNRAITKINAMRKARKGQASARRDAGRSAL